MRTITLTINEKPVTATVEPRMHLADFMRERLSLTGTHIGCEHGVCGACTVLIDGSPARSCITYAVACDGARITTVEGLDDDPIAAELRTAFSREHALQCGYCTPGMLISARDVVIRLDHPSEKDIRVAMSGNLCRCTGYVGIVRAVEGVLRSHRAGGTAAIPGAGRTGLGPVGSGHAAPTQGTGTTTPQRQPRQATARNAAASSTAQAHFTPQASFAQTFVVAYRREAVWAFFADVPAVAACLPGASLTGPPADGHATGKMRVKVGPMSAEFHGAADITRDPSTWSGTIIGSGRDARSDSATRGRITYRLSPVDDSASTRVDITVAYALTGAFAQFSRSGLILDIANRMTQTFAQNLEVRLAGGDKGEQMQAAELNAGSLFVSALAARVKAWFRRLFRG
ncbi:MAG: 2Fe-2S iron-sulfur cluster binding domain-containing protein [Rhizobiales bacterium]|nr:2Fe-2S iron-sulfur cluster binding domain-containing protein [Hyphomicrobiales bacterium]